MLQRLPIALAQAKADNTPENLLNEIIQIIYSLYQEKEIIEKVYNIMNSIKLEIKTDIIFMNSENSKTSDPYRLLLNILDKINLKRSDKYVTLSKFSISYKWENIKMSPKSNKFKKSTPTQNEFDLPDGSYSVSDIQYYFKYILKKHKKINDKTLIIIQVNKIENRLTFQIKAGYYLEILMPETMKLLGSTKSKILKMKLVKMCLIQKL